MARSWMQSILVTVVTVLLVAAIGCGEDEVTGGQVDNDGEEDNRVVNANEEEPNQSQNQTNTNQSNANQDNQTNQNNQNNDNQGEDPQSCQDDDDCDPDEVCALDEPGGEGECVTPTDDLEDGEACTDSAQCESGLCHDGICTSECTDDDECADDLVCGGDADVDVCVPPTLCTADGDCDPDDRCVVDRNGDVSLTCDDPVGPGEPGDECSDDDDCASGLCLDGECSQPCDNPSDCEADGDYVCTGEDLGDGEDTYVCTEQPPESCVSDEDCDGSDRCVASVTDDQFGFVCDEPNADGGEGGDTCSDDSDCAQNLCEDGVCKAPCDSDELCEDIPGSECTTSTYERNGADGSASTCTVPEFCLSDDDCTDDDVCAVVTTADDDLDTVCLDDNDGAESGTGCDDDDDCLSRFCNDAGFCSSPCEDGDHCGDYQQCDEDETVTKDGVDGELDICGEIPITECSATYDCDLDDTACNSILLDENDEVDGAFCGFTNPGESSLGASCTESANCESDFCWPSEDDTTGECTEFCEETDRDCADDQVCAAMGSDLGACLASCTTNDDCDGGNVCQYQVDEDDNVLYTYCDHTVGDGEVGEECSSNLDCETGACLEVSIYSETDLSCFDDLDCPSEYVCDCPMDDPNCSSWDTICISEEPTEEESLCTKLCDPANGDADCDEGGMTRCTEATVTWDDGFQSDTLDACSTEADDE